MHTKTHIFKNYTHIFKRNYLVVLLANSVFSNVFAAFLKDVEQQQEIIIRKDPESQVRKRAILRIQQALIAAQEVGDEKLQIVQQINDLIENKARQLDLDFKNLGILLCS